MQAAPLAGPILALQVDAVKDLDGVDALPSLWTLFTKCKESLQDGRRLENISWRLWHRELTSLQQTPRSPTPSNCSLSPSVSPVTSDSEISQSDTESEPESELNLLDLRPALSRRRRSSRHSTPLSPDSSKPHSKSRSPNGRLPSPKTKPPARTISFSSQITVSDTDRSEYMVYRRDSLVRVHSDSSTGNMGPAIGKVISQLLPEKLVVSTAKNLPSAERGQDSESTVVDGLHHSTSDPRSGPLSANITLVRPSTPLNHPPPSSGPRVVVVHPTPHPTPPATPLMPSTTPAIAQPDNTPTHLLPPSVVRSKPREVPSRTGSPRPDDLVGLPRTATDSESSPTNARAVDDETLKTSQRLFFLQQSPQSEGDSTSASSGSNRGRPLIPTSLMNAKNVPTGSNANIPAASGSHDPSSKSSTSTAVMSDPSFSAPHHSLESNNKRGAVQEESSRSRSCSPSGVPSDAGRSAASVGSKHGSASGSGFTAGPGAVVRKAGTTRGQARPGMFRHHSHQGHRAHPYTHHAHTASAHAHAKGHQKTASNASAHGAAAAVPTSKAHKFKIGSASSGGSRSTEISLTKGAKSARSETERREREEEGMRITAANIATLNAAKKGKGKEREREVLVVDETRAPLDAAKVEVDKSSGSGTIAQANGGAPPRKRIELTHESSSEFETTDVDDSEDDSWSDDDDDGDDDAPERSRERTIQAPPQPIRTTQPTRNRHEHTVDNVRVEEAAQRAQEHLDMFAKLPRRSYVDLGQRSQSGLLSTLFHPPPEMFPPGHPYRQSLSSQDISSFSQNQSQRPQPQRPQQRSVLNPYPNPYTGRAQGQGWAPPQGMTATKSESATTAVAPATATGFVVGSAGTTASATTAASQTRPTRPVLSPASGASNYKPRGRPQDVEVDEDSDDEEDPEDQVQMSKSVAQQRLAALAKRSNSSASINRLPQQQQAARRLAPPAHEQHAPGAPQRRQQSHPEMQSVADVVVEPRPTLTSVASAPIPLCHPYNLPAPPTPFTPHTTRRNMLSNELSESLRRNLLWERKVSKASSMGGVPRRQVGVLGGGLRPLTTLAPPMPGLNLDSRAGTAGVANGIAGKDQEQEAPSDVREERRQAAMARHRSWLDDYHGSGW